MKKTVLLIIVLIFARNLFSQDFPDEKANKYLSWALYQLVPSPAFFQDANDENARIQFGFKWHITPLSVSFWHNKYVSPVQSFFIYPARRFSGSAEIFIDPELATSSFNYSNVSIFGASLGSRVILPLPGKGENICFSLGGKITLRKNFDDDKNYYSGAETGMYFFGGLVGFQYTRNFNTKTKYNFNLYIKYF